MKRKFLVLGLVFTLSFTSLCGCGKDDDSDNHHKSSDTETSSQDDDIKDKDNKSAGEEDDNDSASSDYVAPTQEILDADLTDFKFQIEDTVFTLKPGDTVEKLMDQLPDNFLLFESFTDSEYTTKNLVSGDRGVGIYVIWTDGNRYYTAMGFTAENLSSDDCELGECIITKFHFVERDDRGDIRNMYLAKGIPFNIPTDDRFSYENIKDTLEEFGVQDNGDDLNGKHGVNVSDYAGKVVLDDDSDSYHYYIYVFTDDPYSYSSNSYPVFTIEIEIDENTQEGTCIEAEAEVYKQS